MRLTAAVVLAVLGGCASGPEHRVPATDVPPAFLQAPVLQGDASAADLWAIAAFWRGFADPTLDRLVDTALAANLDVQLAQSRLRELLALRDGASAERLPTIGVDGSATRTLAPQWQQPGRSREERTASVFAASGLMNWELDLFGRRQRGLEAAEALVAAGRYDLGSAQAAVVAQVAVEYFTLRGVDQRLQVAQDALRSQRESLRLAQARLEVGRGTDLDVARSRGLVATTAAAVPALQSQREALLHRLATLTAQPAAEVVQRFAAAPGGPADATPRLAMTDLAALPIGTPEALLSRRADIRSAERQLAAASADIGVAVADRFPRLSLSGLLGLNDPSLSGLGRGGAVTASVGAALTWSAWDFGRVGARVAGAEQRHVTAQLRYRQTVLNALQETETALSAYTRGTQQSLELAVAAEQNEAAARIARARFAAGSSDLLAVLDAERQALAAQDLLVQARVGTAAALVEVYRALGGGWPAAPAS